MRQGRTLIYIEFNRGENIDEIDAKIHKAFPDNVKRTMVGIDAKNFNYPKLGLVGPSGETHTVAEMQMSGVPVIYQLMRCVKCNRTWSAGGFQKGDDKFLVDNSWLCKQCGEEGERVE